MSNSVLVVEDTLELSTVIERMLAQRGYEVRCVASIAEAVAMLKKPPTPCLVLWDPTTLPLGVSLVALASCLGVDIATIPVGITSTGQTHQAVPVIAKRLTSLEPFSVS